MKLWLLQETEHESNGGWNTFDGFVIRAVSEAEARRQANCKSDAGDDGRWLDDERTTCEEILSEGAPRVVLGSFNNG
jgi:hypothetical protein